LGNGIFALFLLRSLWNKQQRSNLPPSGGLSVILLAPSINIATDLKTAKNRFMKKCFYRLHLLITLGGAFLLMPGWGWAQCPTLQAIMVDGCGAPEVNGEFVIVNSGGGFNVNNLGLDVPPNTTATDADMGIAGTCPWGFPTGVTLPGCANVVLVGPGQSVPPNVLVVIFTSSGANGMQYDFSTLCSSGQTIYVMRNSCSRTAGAFVNYMAGVHIRTVSLITSSGCNSTINYNAGSLPGIGDGDFYMEGVPPTYGNNGCVAPPVTLPCVAPSFNNPGNQSACNSYTLPAITGTNLSGNEAYFTGPNGAGTQYLPGNSITNTATLYIYDPASGCSPNPIFTVNVTPTPTANPAGPLAECGAGSATFNLTTLNNTVSGGAGTVNWFTNAGATNPVPNPAAYNTPSTTVYATVSSGACTSAPAAVTLTVNPLPTANPAGPLAECGAGSATFNLTTLNNTVSGGAGTVNWFTNAGATNPVPNPAAYNTPSTTVYATVSSGACTSAPAAVTLTVNPLPTANPAGPLAECGAGSATFNLTTLNNTVSGGAGTVNWFTNAGATNPVPNPAAYNTPSTTVYATVSSGACTSAPAAVTLTVNPLPTANPAGPLAECGAGSATFNLTTLNNTVSGGAGTVNWFTNAGATNPVPNPAAYNTPSTTVYATVSSGACTSAPAAVTLTVNPLPTANPAGPLAECGAGSATFNLTTLNNTVSGGAGTVNWFTNAGATNPVPNPAAYNTPSTTVYATVSSGACTSAPAAVTLTVNPLPTANPAGPLAECGAGSATFNLTTLNNTVSGGAGTVNWFTNAGATNPVPNPAAYNTPGTTVYATVSSGACTSAPAAVTLTVNPTPAANPAGPLSQCGPPGGTATFNLTALNNTISGGTGTVSWFTNPGATIPVPNPAAFTTGSTTVYATVAAGSCASSPVPVMLTVASTLVANTPSTPFTICYSIIPFNYTENLNLVINQINGGTGLEVLWYVDAAGNTPLDPMDPNVILQLITNGWNPIYAAVTDGSCTSATVPVGVVLSTFPTASSQSLSACGSSGQATFNLTSLNNAISGGSGTVSWFTNPGATNPIFTPDFYTTGPSTVYAVVTNAVGCNSNPAAVSLFINPQPNINPLPDATACGAYVLPPITGSGLSGFQAYYTSPNGGGATLSPGDPITASRVVYIYDSTGPGCFDEETFIVTISPPPSINPIQDAESCTAYTLPPITGTNLTGMQGYYTEPGGGGSLLFSGEMITSSQLIYAYDGLPGCASEQAFLVSINQPPSLVLQLNTPISCSGADDGSLTLAVSGGTPNFQYNWNVNALDGTQNPTGLSAGSYAVTVTDGAGCSAQAAITLTEPAAISMNCNVINPVLTPGGSEGEATISFSGGSGPYSISWAGPVSGAGTTPTPGLILASNLEAGTYVATIIDGNDCSETCTFTLNAPNPADCELAINLVVFQHEGCPGSNDGIIILRVFNAVGPYTVLWDDGTQDEEIRIGLSAGIYSVTVVDSDSCQAFRSVTMVNSFSLVEAAITPADTICRDECFTFDISFTGEPPFSLQYQVDTGANSQIFQFQSDFLEDRIVICPADFGHDSGGLPILFIQAQDLNCAVALNQLETIQVHPGDTTYFTTPTCDPSQASSSSVLLQNRFGCDSLIITETVFFPNDTIYVTIETCNPAQVGVDTIFLQNSAGCDSLVITQTVFDPSSADTTYLAIQTCDPAQVGTDTLVLQNSLGCDSLVITETTLLPADTVFLAAQSCDPAQVGTDTLVLQNSLGCDSLVITQTSLLPADTVFLAAQSCDPAQVGTDTLVLQNSLGCDSLVITRPPCCPPIPSSSPPRAATRRRSALIPSCCKTASAAIAWSSP
jgi:hypothetical protein